MSPQVISDLLFQIFSEEGYSVNGLTVKCQSPLVANIASAGGRTTIDFGNNFPRAEVKKIITLYVYIEGVMFGKDSGSIKLKNFPDINFGYDTETVLDFLSKNIPSIKFGDDDDTIKAEIKGRFSDKNKQKIAEKCLQYAREWSTISTAGGVEFSKANRSERSRLRSQCADFVRENVKEEVEKEYSSVFLTFVLITVILPAIISWVVHRVLDELFNQ